MSNEGFCGKPIDQHASSVPAVEGPDIFRFSLVHQHSELAKENERLRAKVAELEFRIERLKRVVGIYVMPAQADEIIRDW